MKRYKLSSLFTLFLFVAMFGVSCGEDRSHEYYDLIEEDQWLDEQMREIYLWYKDIPASSSLNYFQDRKTFFSSLLSKKSLNNKGDLYSYIDTLDATTAALPLTKSYGIDVDLYTPNNAPKVRIARVVQVFANSPASQAGLHRGDWITQVGGEDLSSSNAEQLLSGNGVVLTRVSMHIDHEKNPVFTKIDEVTLTTARVIEEMPVQCVKVITKQSHKIGYLCVNHFRKKKPNDTTDDTYNEAIRTAVATLVQEGITDMVLDLRYNQGGYLKGAQVLGSTLNASGVMGQTLFNLEHNDKYTGGADVWSLDNALAGGYHLSLNKLYVIVSSRTAGAAEALIQALSPYYPVVTLGKKTAGAPIATTTLQSPDFKLWVAHPVVAYVKDKNNVMSAVEGITPTYQLDEHLFVESFASLGDEQEILLRNAIHLITNGTLLDAETTTTTAMQKKPRSIKAMCLTE
jgi:C-terminal processing protease CtpA/Prc